MKIMTIVRDYLTRVSSWLLFFSLVSTAVATLQAQFRIEDERTSQFELRMQEAKFDLENQVNTYVELLRGIQSQLISNPALAQSSFEQTVRLMGIVQRLPGVQAVGFARKLGPGSKNDFLLSRYRSLADSPEGYPVPDLTSANNSSDAMIVQYIEPIAANRRGAWFDHNSEPKRRVAIDRARDAGTWTATGRIRLFVEPDTVDGIVIYMPVYLGGAIPQTTAERRERFFGTVFLGVRIDDMLRQVVVTRGLRDNVRIDIHEAGSQVDGPMPNSSNGQGFSTTMEHGLLATLPRSVVLPRQTLNVNFGGSYWQFDATPLPGFRGNTNDWLPKAVGIVGLVLSLMFFNILRSYERSLSSRERSLKGVLNSVDQILISLDFPELSVRYVSPAIEKIYGMGPAAFYDNRNLWFEAIHRDDRVRIIEAYRNLEDLGQTTVQFRVSKPDGEIRWIRCEVHFVRCSRLEPARIDAACSDITLQYRLEDSLRRSNRALRAIHDCERVLLEATDEHMLLPKVCDVISTAGYQMVWAGEVAHDGGTLVTAGVTGPGRQNYRYLEVPLHSASGEPLAVIGEALAKRRPIVANNFTHDVDLTIWCRQALHLGLRSKIALPLYDCEETLGALIVYSSEWDAFDAEEIALLTGLSQRVMTAIQMFRQRNQKGAVESALRLRQRAIEASPNAIVITSATGPDFPVEYVNPAFERMTGYAASEIVGHSLRVLQGDDRDQPGLLQIRSIIAEKREGNAIVRNYRKDGTIFWSDIHIAPVKDEHGAVQHFVATKHDVTQLKQNEEELERLANHDALTDLPNRVLLRDRLEQSIAQASRNGRQIWVVFMDLDRFKDVNDSFGHKAGDGLLKTVADRLQSAVRKTDTVARIGGDEFVLILTDRADGAERLGMQAVQRIRDVIAQPMTIDSVEFLPTCSIGVAAYPSDGVDAETLMMRADVAMYRAKQCGRNNFQFYAPEMEIRSLERLRMEQELRLALERDEFELHYQPQVDARTAKIVGTEALIRWNHPERGMVPPGVFIALAEETGLIVPVGTWVLRTACAQAKKWHDAGFPLRVSVNLSARQFSQPDLAASIRNILREAEVDPDDLEIELTESMVMTDVDRAIETLGELNAIGVRIAIDDFGTGYSSLSYLKQFPLNTLKIDRSFISDIASNAGGAAIVSAIISLSHSLKLKVIAEGVETEQQLEHLRNCRCDEVQGYFFGKPVPALQMEQRLMEFEVA